MSISLNGTKLDQEVAEGTWTRGFSIATQEGKTYSITAAASGLESGAEYSVTATFKDSAGTETTLESSFSTPALYTQGHTAPASAAGFISAREYHGVGGVSIPQLTGHPTFPDSPGLEADAGYFEWPQSGDINEKPAGNVKDNYGVQMSGFFHPPATGEYQFAIAADDNAQLWVSSDHKRFLYPNSSLVTDLDQLLSLFDSHSNRLFTQNVLSFIGSFDRPGHVEMVGKGIIDRINFLIEHNSCANLCGNPAVTHIICKLRIRRDLYFINYLADASHLPSYFDRARHGALVWNYSN